MRRIRREHRTTGGESRGRMPEVHVDPRAPGNTPSPSTQILGRKSTQIGTRSAISPGRLGEAAVSTGDNPQNQACFLSTVAPTLGGGVRLTRRATPDPKPESMGKAATCAGALDY
jgi:hypothetical protein